MRLLVEDSAIERQQIRMEVGSCRCQISLGSVALSPESGCGCGTLVLLDWNVSRRLSRRIRNLGANGAYIYMMLSRPKDKKQDPSTAMAAGDDYLANRLIRWN